jgi:hypothetical protein
MHPDCVSICVKGLTMMDGHRTSDTVVAQSTALPAEVSLSAQEECEVLFEQSMSKSRFGMALAFYGHSLKQ